MAFKLQQYNRDFNFDQEIISELEEIVNIKVMMDLFDIENHEGIASSIPSCYTSLSKEEQKIVDKLTVKYFVNKLMRGGELVTGNIDKLKPTNKISHVGNSTKRAMHEKDYEEVIGNKSL